MKRDKDTERSERTEKRREGTGMKGGGRGGRDEWRGEWRRKNEGRKADEWGDVVKKEEE